MASIGTVDPVGAASASRDIGGPLLTAVPGSDTPVEPKRYLNVGGEAVPIQ